MSKIGGQNKKEWDDFIEYLQDKNIRSYLEVGAREGVALRYLVEKLPIKFVAVVDLPGANWGKNGSEVELKQNLDALGCEYKMALGDSKSKEIIDSVRREYDLVFIDGDHTYGGVKADYKNYAGMGRIVAFHDINQKPGSRAYGATRLWNKIKPGIEFINEDSSNKGIGVIDSHRRD